jgi:hypothetical protein
MKRNTTFVVALAAVLAALAVPAVAAAVPVAAPGAPTDVREFAGTIVFSQFDAATGQWRLAIRRAGAAPELLAVAPSTRPFRADIGPDSAGRPELIYQRCAPVAGAPSGCDLFVYALDGATGERPVRNNLGPTIWRGRVAWTRDYGSGSEPNPIVYTKTLTVPRSRPSTRLAGVPQRRCGDVDEQVCGPTSGRTVRELELWGENLAQSVSYSCGGCSGIDQAEVRMVDLGDRSARQIAFQVVGLSGQSLIGLSFSGGRVNWYRACLGDPSGCIGGRAGAFRSTVRGTGYERGPGGPIELHGFADATTSQYQVIGCSEETQGPFNANCRIEQVPEPPYSPTRPPRR